MVRYLTTTLPYVNADPHVGFAVELIQADALARSWRIQGDDVYFSTGTDEHGQKIFEAAQKNGQEAQAYVDHYANEVMKLKETLDLSNDGFIRTTDAVHIHAAQEMWRRCSAKGDIYKKSYSGLYCVGCEAYKTEKDIEDEHCPLHPSLSLETLTEENYFFKFSNYTEQLLRYLSNPESILPDWRREEALNFVKGGLEDFSISREKARLSWGVPVPEDDSQVMYVWFDALTGYLSTLGWPEAEDKFNKYWKEGHTIQVAGKDQVRFQSLMWQAMLLSADLPHTDQVFYHGFINSGGQRMSKSLGNVISPYELVQKYGTDATRFMLLRHVHPVEDSDVTWEKFDEWYTADLVNGLGNVVARVMKLAETYLDSPVSPEQSPKDTITLETFEFNTALDTIWARIGLIDERITNEEPFKVVKEDAERGKRIIAELAGEVYIIGSLLQAFMPKTSALITAAVLENKKPENLFPRLP